MTSSLLNTRQFTYVDFCTQISGTASKEMQKKVHELISKWFQTQPKMSIISGQISQGGWRTVSKEVDTKLVQGLDPFDYFFQNSESDNATLIEYTAYSSSTQESSSRDQTILEKLDPELKKVKESPRAIFNHFDQMSGEERHLGLAICYSAGIGTERNWELAADHAEKAQGHILPQFAALRYARILEELLLSPQGEEQKKELYKAKLFALYEKGEKSLLPTLMLRYAHLIQFGSLDLVAKDRLSEGNAAHLLGKMCLDLYLIEKTNNDLVVSGMALLTHAAKLCKHPKALEDLAALQESGKIISQNQQEAFKNYSSSLQLGNLAASYHVARCYENSIGTDQHELKALNHYKIACDSGIDKAALDLGRMYEEGIGTRPDAKQALDYYRIAKNKHVPGAVEKYGAALAKGFGGEGRRKEGIELLETEVKNNNSSAAMYELSRIYHLEKGELKKRADFLLRDAAKLCNVDAIYFYALSYLNEAQTSNQPAMCVKSGLFHLKNAAKLGSTKAMFKLATYTHPEFRKVDQKFSKEALDWAEMGIQFHDATCAMMIAKTFYDRGMMSLQVNGPNSREDIAIGVQYYEYAASWGSKCTKLILIKHYLANKEIEKIQPHLQSLIESPNNPPDVLLFLAELYGNSLGEDGDLQKAVQYIGEAIELVQKGGPKVEEYKAELRNWAIQRANYESVIKKQRESIRDINERILPEMKTSLLSIKDLIQAEQEKELRILGNSRADQKELSELTEALELYFRPLFEQIDPQQERQLAAFVAAFMAKYNEYFSSSQRVINLHHGKTIDYMINAHGLLLKMHRDFKIAEKLQEINKGWQSIKTSICERYENERLKLQKRNAFSQWAEGSRDQVCDKFDKYQEKIRHKIEKNDRAKADFIDKLRSLTEAGLSAIEEGKAVQEVREEIDALILKMNVGLDSKIELVVSSSSSSSKGEGEDLNAKLNDLQRTLSVTNIEMHNLERSARQTEERLLKQIEELTRAHALEREQQRKVEEKLRKENRELQGIVQAIPATTSIEILEKRIVRRIEELKTRAITTVKGYSLNNFPPRKYNLDGIETILLGIGFQRQGEANGSHRHYERGQMSMGTSPHNGGEEVDKSQIQQALNYLLADLNAIE